MFFQSLRTDPESSHLPIGAAGFCWGGLYALRLTHSTSVYETSTLNSGDAKATTKKPLVDAAFMAHPQPISLPIDVENVMQPIAVAIGDRDWCTSNERIERIKEIFRKKKDKVLTEVEVYPGAGHGFAVRYDPWNPNMAAQAQEAQNQAVSWFECRFS